MSTGLNDNWYEQPTGDAHAVVFQNVRRIEQEQGDTFDRLALLESLYDQYSPTGDDTTTSSAKLLNVTENVVASNVDTTYASVATAEVRARFLTDGADFSVQRRAKKLEYYVEGLGRQMKVHRKCRLALKESSKKGGGLVKVYADRWDEPSVEHTRIEDIYVPDEDSRSGAPPLQLHHVQRSYDRDRLKAEYPDAADQINNVYGARSTSTLVAYNSGSLTRHKLTVIESIRLPIGKRPASGKKKSAKGALYVAGRRTVTIENKTLLDEPYHKPHYPFAMISWSERQGSFYPISGAERIAGHQNALNKRNWQIDRILDQSAVMTTYVRPADGNLSAKPNKIGNVVVIKGDYPQAPVLPAVHPETYQSRRDIKESAFDEFGNSKLANGRAIPAGLETGAAVREYRQSASQQFTPQEADFEQLVLDVYYLLVDVCKDLGDAAPMVLESRWRKPIKWSDVDMGQVKIQITAASTLPRSSAGREQTLLEWAQAGIISTDSVRRLIDHPDLERELSMYTSALEVIEQQLEEILEGGIGTPEPYDNLAMLVWRGTATYNNTRMSPGAPEDVLESLRDYVAQASFILAQQQAQNENGMPGAEGIGGDPAAPPGAQPPPPALSPQAMQLRAS